MLGGKPITFLLCMEWLCTYELSKRGRDLCLVALHAHGPMLLQLEAVQHESHFTMIG